MGGGRREEKVEEEGTERVPTFQASARWPVAPVSKAGEPQWILDVNTGQAAELDRKGHMWKAQDKDGRLNSYSLQWKVNSIQNWKIK